jgi:hypothetical protein
MVQEVWPAKGRDAALESFRQVCEQSTQHLGAGHYDLNISNNYQKAQEMRACQCKAVCEFLDLNAMHR